MAFVAAQLINVAAGFHLWSHTYQREMSDLFAVQDEISRAIMRALEVELAAEGGAAASLVRCYTADIEAYHLWAAISGTAGPKRA